jgi:glycine hydroxymethyltransferase
MAPLMQISIDETLAAIFENRLRENTDGFTLIASENHPHPDDVAASRGADDATFAGGYFEGYPAPRGAQPGSGRYYQGVEAADALESLASERLVAVIAPGMEDKVETNLQTPSGAAANITVYAGILALGDKMVAPSLSRGFGHLSHGADSPNIVSRLYEVRGYGVDETSGLINYNEIEELVTTFQPKLLVSGFSSYPREVDWQRIAAIANANKVVTMADISHPGGLIGAGLLGNPMSYGIDIVTSTTHKTWGGMKGAVIAYNRESLSAKIPEGVVTKGANKGRFNKIDFAAFPGLWGGPNMSTIASYASTFRRAKTSEFANVQRTTLQNARALAEALKEKGWPLSTGGTDNHIVLISDVTKIPGVHPTITDGWEAAKLLEKGVGIVTNKNAVPGVAGTPIRPKGLRLGTPAISTRGLGINETCELAAIMDQALKQPDSDGALAQLKKRVRDMAHTFPVPKYV